MHVCSFVSENRVKWSDLPNSQKVKSILVSLFKICVVVGCLYLFVCSISLLGNAFQVLGKRGVNRLTLFSGLQTGV